MRWEIHLDVPDEVDILVPNERKKYLTSKLTECLHQLIANEAINSIERDMHSVKPIIYREIYEQNND